MTGRPTVPSLRIPFQAELGVVANARKALEERRDAPAGAAVQVAR